MSVSRGFHGCDLCLVPIEGQMTQVQYSRGAFVYGTTQVRVTPDPARLRDVQVCTDCAAHLRGLMAQLLEQKGRPARRQRDASTG